MVKPKALPSRQELKRKLPDLLMGDEPFDAYEDEIAEELENVMSAVIEQDNGLYKQAFRQFSSVVTQIADDNVPPGHLRMIGSRVNEYADEINKKVKVDPQWQAFLREQDQQNPRVVNVTSSMNAKQVKDYFSKGLKHVADLMVKGEKSRAVRNLMQLETDLEGSPYDRYSAKDLMKMAQEIAAKQQSGKADAPRLNFDMVGKVKWDAFFKTYGVTEGKLLKPSFVTLAKEVVKEGPSAQKPLGTAKTVFKVLQGEKMTGKFKSAQHLLGALADAISKNGGQVKLLNEGAAKKLIAS